MDTKRVKRTLCKVATAAAVGIACATCATGTAMAQTAQATTYEWGGRTRVMLPDDVLRDLEGFADTYMARLREWSAEEPEQAAYYGGLEEGFNRAFQTVMGRLGYLDSYYALGSGLADDPAAFGWLDPAATLADVPDGWEQAPIGATFTAWELADFGED